MPYKGDAVEVWCHWTVQWNEIELRMEDCSPQKTFYFMPKDSTITLWLENVRLNLPEITWLVNFSIVNDHY